MLNSWLSHYVAEMCNKNGAFYPPSTLYQLLVGILRHMRIENSSCPNFLDKRDPAFKQLHGTLDSHFRKLHESGLGRKVKHAELITKEDESKLWASGEMGRNSPRALQNLCSIAMAKISVFVAVKNIATLSFLNLSV